MTCMLVVVNVAPNTYKFNPIFLDRGKVVRYMYCPTKPGLTEQKGRSSGRAKLLPLHRDQVTILKCLEI